MEEAMRHFYIKALIEKTAGEHADWKAVDNAMIQAATIAEKVASYRHAKLSAVRLAGEIKHFQPSARGATASAGDGATLDELLERIKSELTMLGRQADGAHERNRRRNFICSGSNYRFIFVMAPLSAFR
jgi:hypothetical protein